MMTLQLVIQIFVFGVFVGALYGLAAVGFSFIYGVMRILNIAHGELIMLGGYVTYILFSYYHIDPFLSLPLVAIVLFILGAIFYKGFFAHIIKYEEELKGNTSLLIAFGLILILEQLALLSFTADEQSVAPAYAGGGFEIFNVYFPFIRVGILLVSVILIFGFQLFLRKTYLGKGIRASAQNWESATLMGINISRVYLVSFGLSCSLAGMAGSMVVLGYSINPAMGTEWILKAMVVSILAGVGSVGGAFIAGIMLGVVEAFSALYLGPYTQVVGLLLFLVVLMFKPQGLFGATQARV
jgi:branched-chain amino acid transport system permease protein